MTASDTINLPANPARLLCLHGVLLMFFAFIAGFMIGAVAVGQVEGSMDGWRLAHMEPLTNALLLFAIAACWKIIALPEPRQKLVALCLVLMAWCNTTFGFMRGITNAPGFEFNDSLANNITTAAGMLGVPLGIIAMTLILLALLRRR
ncbi:MAG: hypothetical protein KJP25_01500 [Gammaproteobacteria bacterium]|nr:hypothetical protein [Gammaproteobacteria bacterium]NND38950.1 hypothetical protein [Pseudomonadales bacterium]NNL10688.1 hypothetical protein [Pseudomonadales bacterium]RZV55816.1 MAG: hypothetical protein EX270_06110 [Pseudomonadales bacterium]